MIADEATMARLMAAAQNGDRQSYTVLLEEASKWLQRFFSRKLPHGQVDDLVQEVLMAIHNKRASYDLSRPFIPWMAAIARYRWVDHLRKVYRAEEDQLDDWDAAEDSDEESVMARVSLERLLGFLPQKQSEVIELVKIEGHSIRDAANMAGQTESAVKVNIHRGLKKLAAIIEEAE